MSLFNKEDYKNKKSLIIYFSRADENYVGGQIKYLEKGNTEVIAEYIKDITKADIFKVERKIPYSKDHMKCIEEAKQENETNARPELVKYLDNIDKYEVIYIGGPIYWGVLPAPLVTQLEKLDFTGKIVRPFVTHEGSGLAGVPDQLKRICKGADIKDGLAIVGGQVNSSRGKVEKWI